MPHSVRWRPQPGNRSGRSCFRAWYRIPAIAPTWPGYARASPGLRSGDALVCVTDGVIERTDGVRQFDDDVAVLVLAARPRDAYFRSISSASMTTPSPLAVSTALRIR